MLPEGEDLNEWVAVNTVDFFNQINMLYGTITEFCTEQSCPVMSAGPKYEVSNLKRKVWMTYNFHYLCLVPLGRWKPG